MEDLEHPKPGVSFVPCLTWVKKGFAKEIPVKDETTKEDLETLLKNSKAEIDDDLEEGIESDGEEKEDEYKFSNYDEEDVSGFMRFDNVVVSSSFRKDPNIVINDDDVDGDSELSDDHIRLEDNLLLIGRVKSDTAILEVYVHNENEGYIYVHHDCFLPSVPLCIEWLNYQPQAQGAQGSFCAIGYMTPAIEVWDLDVMNCLEPIVTLGRKPRKTKGIKGIGHKDAVLDLSWNLSFPHILASGSVDETVLLWDLDNGFPATTIKVFSDKVQSVKWHPFESQMLLTGSCDNAARVFDCRLDNSFKEWIVDGEVERVLWDHFHPFNFFASTSSGKVYYVDCRHKDPLWILQSHTAAVTGLSLSAHCPGLLTTACAEGTLKIWDCGEGENESQPDFIFEKDAGVGVIHCLASSLDDPYTFATGGDKRDNYFEVFNLLTLDAGVETRFLTRKLLQSNVKLDNIAKESSVKSAAVTKPETLDSMAEQQPKPKPMDTTNAIESMKKLSLQRKSKKSKKSTLIKEQQLQPTRDESLKTVPRKHLNVKKPLQKKKGKNT